jgi:hypothetical protein
VAERDAEQIQRDIEKARVSLASSVDQIVYRTNPKRVAENAKTTLMQKALTPQGKAVIGGAGAIVVILIVRRIRRRGDER